MFRRPTRPYLLASDALAGAAAFATYQAARFAWQWFGTPEMYPSAMLLPMATLVGYWMLVFAFFGLYRERFAASRLEELGLLGKAVATGVLVLVFAIYLDALRPGSSRAAIFFYAVAVFGYTGLGRLLVRSWEKRRLLRGIGRHRALVVGSPDRIAHLRSEMARYPEAGLFVVGTVLVGNDEDEAPWDVPVGSAPSTATLAPPTDDVAVAANGVEAIPRLLETLGVEDVLVTLANDDYDVLLDVLRVCDRRGVTIKLVPDFYTLLGGMARTEHLYGLPLIEVLPSPMSPWQESTKRLMDALLAAVVLVVGLPVWVLVGMAVRLTSKGPALYRQVRVGQDGEPFTMLKFRTMHDQAEAATGPVWATDDDPRYTPLGRWLRTTRLDEVPQFWNVLKGEMSLVGPRPERPFFVERLAAEIPLYNRRHRVKPGITGWAQVKRPYDTTVDDVRTKVKYDLFYIENMSLGMDVQILLRTVRTALRGEGR
ncbi:MAG: sugar transferase [Bacteroidetes bacterium]|nr:sugar transferase [Bacteroidota bacterium]